MLSEGYYNHALLNITAAKFSHSTTFLIPIRIAEISYFAWKIDKRICPGRFSLYQLDSSFNPPIEPLSNPGLTTSLAALKASLINLKFCDLTSHESIKKPADLGELKLLFFRQVGALIKCPFQNSMSKGLLKGALETAIDADAQQIDKILKSS